MNRLKNWLGFIIFWPFAGVFIGLYLIIGSAGWLAEKLGLIERRDGIY